MPDRVLSICPEGSFTYNAIAREADGTNSEVAQLKYRVIREEGTITLSHTHKTYNVMHPRATGDWSLQLDDPHSEEKPLIKVNKPKWYRDRFVIEMDGNLFEMVRPSLWRRDYIVGRMGEERAAADDDTDSDADEEKEKGKQKTKREKKKKAGTLSGAQVGDVTADSAFRRSYTVTFNGQLGVELPLLCYWLVSMLNKRANAASSSAASGG